MLNEVFKRMSRMTVETIMRHPAFRNPLKERELDLRGNKFPRIENLGCTMDQFDCIDLTNNQLTSLEDFPILKRLTTLIANNNLISKVDQQISTCLPNLSSLILTNNNISSFQEILHFSKCKNLERMSLMENPISKMENYRYIIIAFIPQLKFLDFQKITASERMRAEEIKKEIISNTKV